MTARTALKVAATEGLKKPPERRWPGGAPPVTDPRWSRRQRGEGRALVPRVFSTPIPLQGANPSPSVSPTTQNDREGKGLFSCFHISRKNSIFPGLNSSFPCFYVFSDGKKENPGEAPGPAQGRRVGYGEAAAAARGCRCPREEPRGVPADVPRPRPASGPGTFPRPPSAGAGACPCYLRSAQCRKVPRTGGASGEPAPRRVERGHGSCRDLPPPASNRHAGLCRLHWPL